MEERNSQTERKILQAATRIFIQQGKAGARMQTIAEQAGINKALLHYYFRSKDHLYEEVFRHELAGFLDTIFASVSVTQDIRQTFRTFINQYLDGLSRRPELIRFIIWEIHHGGDIIGQIIHEKLSAVSGGKPFPIVAIEHAGRTGAIRPVNPVQTMISLLGMCIYPFVARPIIERIIPGLNIMAPDFLEQRKHEIYNLLWEGIQPTANRS